MIWLQGWTVTTGGTGSLLRAPALFRPAKRGRYPTQVQMGRGWWRPTAGRKLRAAGGTEVCGGGSRKISDPQMLLLRFCLLLNCGSLGRGGADWSAPWPINWEAQRPLTPMMMQGDRANGERWLASSYSSWMCHQWCSRVEKGSVDPNSAPPPQFFVPPSSFILFCGRFSSLSFLQNFSINRLNIKYRYFTLTTWHKIISQICTFISLLYCNSS